MTPSNRHSVRALVALADRRRRARAADRLVVTAAPVVAGLALVLALVGSLAGWSPFVAVVVLSAAAVALAAFALVERRSRPTSDVVAARIDEEAGLGGELRSAHWFESMPRAVSDEHAAWQTYHVERAAGRAAAVDWGALYPPVRAARRWVLTAVMSAAVLGLAVKLPAREPAGLLPDAAGDPALLAGLPPELQAKLAALLAQLEKGELGKDVQQVSAEDLKDLMANLDPALQKKLAELLEKQALGDKADQAKAMSEDERADRAENAAAGLPEDVRWALEDLAARLAQATEDQRQTNPNNPSASSETGEKGMGSQQAEQVSASMTEAASPMVRESAEDPGGRMMMGGGGPMGGDSRPGAGGNNGAEQGAAEALLLAQALRRELVEASADALGENVPQEDRRKKTEQGTSTLGYTRVAPSRNVESSRAAPPPPVPEARRSLILNFFVRK